MSWIETIIKPLLDEAYKKGFEAGVNAEVLKKNSDHERQLHDVYKYGYLNGQQDAETEIGAINLDGIYEEELKAEASDPDEPSEPFGFVGTLEDMTLVLDEEVV